MLRSDIHIDHAEQARIFETMTAACGVTGGRGAKSAPDYSQSVRSNLRNAGSSSLRQLPSKLRIMPEGAPSSQDLCALTAPVSAQSGAFSCDMGHSVKARFSCEDIRIEDGWRRGCGHSVLLCAGVLIGLALTAQSPDLGSSTLPVLGFILHLLSMILCATKIGMGRQVIPCDVRFRLSSRGPHQGCPTT